MKTAKGRAGLKWGVGAAAVAAIVLGAYWLFRPANGGVGADPNDPLLVAAGQAVYAAHCASCHGVRLEGQPNWKTPNPDGSLLPPPHDASGHTWHHPDSVLLRITRLGGQAVAPPGFTSGMPAFADKLDKHEIRAVLAFIKSTWPEDIRARQEAIDRRAAGR